jgi:hypothetical protein
MTTHDTRTPAERRYDETKSGTIYFKVQPATEPAADPWHDIISVVLGEPVRTTDDEDAAIIAILLEIDGGE